MKFFVLRLLPRCLAVKMQGGLFELFLFGSTIIRNSAFLTFLTDSGK